MPKETITALFSRQDLAEQAASRLNGQVIQSEISEQDESGTMSDNDTGMNDGLAALGVSVINQGITNYNVTGTAIAGAYVFDAQDTSVDASGAGKVEYLLEVQVNSKDRQTIANTIEELGGSIIQ